MNVHSNGGGGVEGHPIIESNSVNLVYLYFNQTKCLFYVLYVFIHSKYIPFS